MKVIDLLNKIANGEELPKRIIYNEYVYQWNNVIKNYEREIDKSTTLNWDYIAIQCLNEEVEIIEDKKLSLENTQYALIPSWFRDEEMIKVINSNFEKHKQALKRIVDYINNMK